MTAKKIYTNNRLSPGWYKFLLTLHIIIAVGLIGADITVIILSVTGLTSGIPDLIRASYLAMDLLVNTALIPLAAGALVTGILLGVGTHWGLTRYYWVLTKLGFILVAITALVFLLRPRINQIAAEVLQRPLADLSALDLGPAGVAVIVGPSVAILILITAAVLGIYKPWGKTNFKKRTSARLSRSQNL